MVDSRFKSMVAAVVAVSLLLALPGAAPAELISTTEALALEQQGSARALVDAYLAREEVATELTELGVDPELARLRAAALSASEIEALAAGIENEPAGGTSVIAVVGITFVVLMILELVGVIDIFKAF